MQQAIKLRLKIASCILTVGLFSSGVSQNQSSPDMPAILQNPKLFEKIGEFRHEFEEFTRLLHTIRRAGITKQRQQIGMIIRVLQPDILDTVRQKVSFRLYASFDLQVASLLALARISDPSAIAQLKQVEPHLDEYFKTQLLPVVIARLKAEAKIPSPRTSADWHKKVRLFLAEAQVSLDSVPKVIEEYYQASISIRSNPPGMGFLYAPREVWAMRQLAEMAAEAYARGVSDAFRVFEPIRACLHVEGERWGKDPILSLRLQLGQYPTAEKRVEWLLDQLFAWGAEIPEDAFLVQALADEGEVAVPKICDELKSLYQRGGIGKGIVLLRYALASIATPSALRCLDELTNSPKNGAEPRNHAPPRGVPYL